MQVNKKLIIITLILLSLFMISAVSAVDADTTTMGDSDSADSEIVANSEPASDVSESANTELKGTDEPKDNSGSFKDLSREISKASQGNRELTLTRDYVFNTSDTYEIEHYTTGIDINGTEGNNNFIIRGDSHTIDGLHMARIFNVACNANLIIENLKIINAKGGAILVNEGTTLDVGGSEFINNTNDGPGGAISSKGQVTISDTDFINNSANEGGAIYVENNNLTIHAYSLFENNTGLNGGAITIYNGDLIIDGLVDFTNNNATAETAGDALGGAINALNSNIYIFNTIFKGNSAEYGGAICVTSNDNITTIIDSIFTNNTAIMGGAISTDCGLIAHNIFTDNRAEQGGAIENEGDGTSIMSNEFKNNLAMFGGAIYTDSTIETIFNTFINNTAMFGGAIYALAEYYDINLTVIESDFINNTAIYDEEFEDGGFGGAIVIMGSNDDGFTVVYHIQDSLFENNTAILNANFEEAGTVSCGGAIYAVNNTRGNIVNTTFKINEAQGSVKYPIGPGPSGGAIRVEFGGDLTIKDSVFEDNSAYMGGAISSQITNNTNNTITIENTNFTNNKAEIGGAIASESNPCTNSLTKLTIIGSEFTENKAITRNGGAIYADDYSKNDVTVTKSTFTNNVAGLYGGAIYSLYNLTIENSDFNENMAAIGGAIYNTGNVTITDGNFTNNTATRAGGAINNAGNATIKNSDFIENKVYSNSSEEIKLLSGGAIENSGILTITGAIFYDNDVYADKNDVIGAVAGGAINNAETGIAKISNTIFAGNNAYTDKDGILDVAVGGAINNVGSITIDDSVFRGNGVLSEGPEVEKAAAGGAINNVETGIAKISKTIFEDNDAYSSNSLEGTSLGGAIANAGNITISDSVFKYNGALKYKELFAGTCGGAIANLGKMNLTNSNFTNDYADIGTEIYNAETVQAADVIATNNIIINVYDKKEDVVELELGFWDPENNNIFYGVTPDINATELNNVEGKVVFFFILCDGTIDENRLPYYYGNVDIYIDGKLVQKDFKIDVPFITDKLVEGEHNITIKFAGDLDKEYAPSEDTFYFNVTKNVTTLQEELNETQAKLIKAQGELNETQAKLIKAQKDLATKQGELNKANADLKPASQKTVYEVKMYLTLKKVKKISKKTGKLYLKVIVKRNGKKLLTKKITIKVKRNKVKAKKSNNAQSKKLSKVQSFKFTVKINGKTYTKKTNKKGKITYTINNLYNKGTYKAKISYKSKYYYKNNGKNIKFKIKA